MTILKDVIERRKNQEEIKLNVCIKISLLNKKKKIKNLYYKMVNNSIFATLIVLIASLCFFNVNKCEGFMDISGTFQLSIFGQQDWKLIEIKNSYSMFRDNIIEFIRSVETGKSRLEFYKTEQIIKIQHHKLNVSDSG